MLFRPLPTFLLVGSLLVGGCATPSEDTINWPVVPRLRPAISASADRALPVPVLPKAELRADLVEAGVFLPLMSDESYIRIEHASLPALLDWYEAMMAIYEFSPAGLHEEGFRRDRGVRILRIFVSMSMMRRDESLEAAPAIGMVRVDLLQPWGPFAPGEARDFLAVATERGTFVVDPVHRLIRPLAFDPFFWRFDGARF